jgi:hypothetical protein
MRPTERNFAKRLWNLAKLAALTIRTTAFCTAILLAPVRIAAS